MGRQSAGAKRQTTIPDLMRGVGAGVILGLPLVYTQEVWLHGSSLDPFVILGLLGITLVLNLAFSHFVGFRKKRILRPVEDAVAGLGLSFLLSAGLLVLLGRIDGTMDGANVLGVIALCAVPIGLGFALGNALAPVEGAEQEEAMKGSPGDLLAAAGGALVLSLNIAPTEEPILLAYEISWVRLVAVVAVSLILSYVLVFYAEFGGREARASHTGVAHGPVTETALAYIVALVVSGLLLWTFGRFEGINGADLAEVVVLAFPASMGAALGRLLV